MTRNAVITGATQGIGKAIAEKLLKEGFSIAICARNEQDLFDIKTLWSKQFPQAKIIVQKADVGIKEEVKSFSETVLKEFSQIDILVNNAGLFTPGNLATEPDGYLESLMAVNFFSAYHLTRFLLPSMQQKQSGHIFNMCSVASLKAYANGGAYSITKYALLGFSDNLRMELMQDNIKVTAIMPGATWSRSWAESGLPQERFVKPEDIAEAMWSAFSLGPNAVTEHIIIRPMLGDI